VGGVSAYDVNLVGRRVLHDRDFRARLLADPEGALDELDLTCEERSALLAGDVARLHALGANGYMLMNIARFEALGLDLRSFSDRIRGAPPG
jgi:hypothetical protein